MTDATNQKVSVIIPCRNERQYIEACIRSVADSDYPEELLEIIVCDGMSDDGTTELLRDLQKEIPILKVVANTKKITPVALNLGITHSTGDYFIILGAHSTMDPAYITLNARILAEKPEVWCSGGVLKNIYTDNLSKNISNAMSSPFGVGSAHFRTGAMEGYVDTAAFALYRKEVVQSIGLFDETLVRNQDDEYNYRITEAGGRIWLTNETDVNYYVRSSWKKLFRQYFQYGYWKVYVNRKHKSVTTSRQLVPFFFVLFLAVGWIIEYLLHGNCSLYFFVLFIYFMMAFASAIRYTTQLKDTIQTLVSFFILHFSYGLGYAKGIADFLLFQKKG
jgi:glycosyltransferase involved in cell wall biosynthesis